MIEWPIIINNIHSRPASIELFADGSVRYTSFDELLNLNSTLAYFWKWDPEKQAMFFKATTKRGETRVDWYLVVDEISDAYKAAVAKELES